MSANMIEIIKKQAEIAASNLGHELWGWHKADGYELAACKDCVREVKAYSTFYAGCATIYQCDERLQNKHA